MTLTDAAKLTTSDVRLPTSPQMCAEKLYGFSCVIDIFHGVGTDIAIAVRACAVALGPLFHIVYQNHGGADSERSALDVCWGILFKVQQDYNGWANKKQHGKLCIVPDFTHVLEAARSGRASSILSLIHI